MKVGVVGTRTFNDYVLLKSKLDELNYNNIISVIISGGATGADSLAEKYANEKSIKTMIFYPEWKKFGKSAGPIRNKLIVNNSDVIIAFWDNKSIGTYNTICQARSNGLNESNGRLFIINI